MKKLTFVILFSLLSFSLVDADNYSSLWKQVTEAENKDLPKSEIEILNKIVALAKADGKYGQLLCAELKSVAAQTSISPDSLKPAVARLVAQEKRAESKSQVLAAVYQSVLGRIYKEHPALADNGKKVSEDYYKKSLSDAALLAKHKDDEYVPLVSVGYDSRIFDNDLLSMLSYEAGDYQTAHDYYVKVHNRPAAMMTALQLLNKSGKRSRCNINKSRYLVSIDSLIQIYSDLKECGELAIERYREMSICPNVTAENKISYIHSSLGKWGSWPRMNILRNAEKELTRPQFNVNIDNQVSLPDKEKQVKLTGIRNVTQLTMHVSRLSIDASYRLDADGSRVNLDNEDDYAKIKKLVVQENVVSQTRKYKGMPDYQLTDDSMTISALPIGSYLVEFTSDNKDIATKRFLYDVSDMFVMFEEMPAQKMRFAVVSATTGQPVAGAKLRLFFNGNYGQGDETANMTCDGKGEVIYNYNGKRRPSQAWAYTNEDRYQLAVSLWGSRFSYYENRTDADYVALYTDRAIYRPGQTVHVSAIVFNNKKGLNTSAEAGVKFKLSLRDANYKVVAEKDVTIDNFGSTAADFSLPQTGLTGRFSVQSDYGNRGSVGFRVEEYKRPTFQIIFPEVNQAYRNGDTLEITAHAKSYAGVPVQGAKVSYTVTRRQALWWWGWGRNPDADDKLAEGTAVTDDQGAFRIEMPMILPEGVDEKEETRYPIVRFYNFTAEATVTDVGGETHSGEMSLPLGSKPTAFGCDLADKIERDSLKSITFSLKNQSGVNISGDVRYFIDGSKKMFTAKTNQPTVLHLDADMLKSGSHQLMAICEKDTIVKKFIVFTMDDTKPCIHTDNWFYQTSGSFHRDGTPVYIQVGSSAKDTHIVYSVMAGSKVIDHGVIDQSDAIHTSKFTYKEEYGTGLLITYAWVKAGHLYRHSTTIQRPLPDKRLLIRWKTFRDRLVPGQKEEWSLNIMRPDGKPAMAQLMTTMYDQSLDQITRHAWSFNPCISQSLPGTSWDGGYQQSVNLTGYADYKPLNEKGLTFSKFDESCFGFNRFYGETFMMSPRLKYMTRAAVVMDASSDELMVTGAQHAKKVGMTGAVSEMNEVAPVSQSDKGHDAEKTERKGESGQIRENFNETAFFYPALMADKSGNVSVKFTLPESVTTWRVMALAHDTLMNYGLIDGETVAKKTVMVQPNMPRFVREGDLATIAAKIFNTSDQQADGSAKIELVNPETDKVVFTQTKVFSAGVDQTANVNFELPASTLQGQNLYICRITAYGKGFSDGEQHYLPILPDREMVTKTVPFTQNGPGKKTIDLTKLFAVKDKNNRLTVEYTNNPAWMMVQTLPVIGKTTDDNAISLSTAYYANSIGRMLMKQSPKIKTAIEMWNQEKGGENSLMSSLEKNQELKDLVLNETPWVNDADNESSIKQQLKNFFDASGMDYRIAQNVEKLKKLQNPDGSWSWWPGMQGSEYMTGDIIKTLVRLNAMTGKQQNTADMLSRAISYMSGQIVKTVEEMKKEEKKGYRQNWIGGTELDFLYSCAIDGRSLPTAVKSANDYLIDVMQKMIKGQSLYAKAMSAVILAKNDKKQKAAEYIQSLKEYSVYTEEMGRYYDAPRAGYSWCDYRIPTEVAAIEAIKSVTPDDHKTVEEMQRWLLQEKRTQSWDTPINSVNAVYAFLNGNTTVLASQEKTVLSIDGKKMDTPQATAGLGYVKVTETGDNMRAFSADKASTGTSWGAVYAQFMQKTTDITDANSGISVKREMTGNLNTLKVGDKVKVRITIKADRDYDFVQVSDRRAACMEPLNQLSGYHWGYYCAPKDNATNYYFDIMRKGTHTIETEYYIDRVGKYETGTCTAQCAYAPEYRATTKAQTLNVVK